MRKTIPVCPNCGSTDLGHDSLSTIARLSLAGGRECRECGYTGIFPEMDADEVEEFDGGEAAEQPERPPSTDRGPSYGRLGAGALLLLLGVGASSHATWGNGLLAGLLAVVIGAAVLAEETSRFHAAQ